MGSKMFTFCEHHFLERFRGFSNKKNKENEKKGKLNDIIKEINGVGAHVEIR